MSSLVRLARAAAWTVVAVLVALGSAGMAAGLDRLPGTPARGELTWAADQAVRPALDVAIRDLEQLSLEVDRLSVLGRGALAAITARDRELLQSTLDDGAVLVTGITRQSAALRRALDELPGFGDAGALRLGAQVRLERGLLVAALAAPSRLAEAWAVLTSGGLTAAHLTRLLEQHDEEALGAIAAGRTGDYGTALERLTAAEERLAEAGRLRDRLRNTIEVGTLSEWLTRNRAYDAALRRLYTALRDSGGRATDEVRDAVRGEEEARARLPRDTRALVIIVAEIGRGGANEAVIEIERVRGRLASALADLREPAAP